RDALMRPGVVVLGGNDNEEDCAHFDLNDHYCGYGHHFFKDHPDIAPLKWGAELREEGRDGLVCRSDGAWWTLFRRDSGAKVRMTFVDDAQPYVRSSAPELVDVKITDYCPFGCPFCYQGSTHQGLHADDEVLGALIRQLGELRVFEMAIGGGEPTL